MPNAYTICSSDVISKSDKFICSKDCDNKMKVLGHYIWKTNLIPLNISYNFSEAGDWEQVPFWVKREYQERRWQHRHTTLHCMKVTKLMHLALDPESTSKFCRSQHRCIWELLSNTYTHAENIKPITRVSGMESLDLFTATLDGNNIFLCV